MNITRLGRLADRLAALCEIAAAAVTAAIFLVMLAQIWFRYVLNSSLLWSEEAALWGLIWVVFLGAAAVSRSWGHVHVPVFVRFLPGRARVGAVLAAKIVVIGFLILLAIIGIVAFGGSFHRTSMMLGVSTKWAKLAIPVGALLMAVLTLSALADDLRRLARDGRGAFDGYGRPRARPPADGS